MNSLQTRVCLLTLTLGLCAAANAQETVPIEYYRPLRNSFSVGVRMIGGAAKVNFSNVGIIPARLLHSPFVADVTRTYDNGFVGRDVRIAGAEDDPDTVFAPAPSEANGIRTEITREAVNGGASYIIRRRVTDSTGATPVVTNSILYEERFHKTGSTRHWGFASPNQVNNDGTVDMSIYDISSRGAAVEAESGRSTGVELQFGHILKRYKRFEWGFNVSAGASLINAKTRQIVRANLNRTTDTFRLDGFTAADARLFAPYNSDDHAETRDPDSATAGDEYVAGTPQLLFSTPTQVGAKSSTPTDVFGYWQIKGAYYMFRAGPIVRFPFAKKWAATVSAGASLAYVGSVFLVDEYALINDVLGEPLRFQNFADNRSEEKRLVGGYYADVNIERWLTVRTGFFAGFSYEKAGKFDHTLAGRNARVDLGGGTGFRFGVITRF